MSKDLDRIRKLLAVALDDRTNPNEADAARLLAERLAAIAGVTLEDALKDSAVGVDPITTVGVTHGDRCVTDWMQIVATSVARVVGCYSYKSWVSADGKDCIVWVGTLDQRFAAGELYAWVVRQIEMLAKGAKKSAPARGTRKWMNDYRYGVACAVAAQAARITDEYRAANPLSEPGLMRLDRLNEAILARLPDNLRFNKNHRRVGSGYAVGRADGNTVNLRTSVGTATAAPNRRLGS